MTPKEVYDDFVEGFERRKFSAGLLVAFIDFYKALDVPSLSLNSFGDVVTKFPRLTVTKQGKNANTLIVQVDDNTLSLRPFYNRIEKYIRGDMKRFDYPSCAPHATQAWIDYIHWLDALAPLSTEELDNLRERIISFLMTELTDQSFDPAAIKIDPPVFKIMLEEFDLVAKKGEPTGAAYQGIVFGFIRADNPHLQVEIDKVRTGSKRLQRVGDVDAWDGERLALSAEVKSYVIKEDQIDDFLAFAHEIGRRGALGMLVTLGFEGEARDSIEGLGLIPLDIEDLQRIVSLWDPLKQRTSVSSFVYYIKHVEKNSSLSERIDEFLQKIEESD